MSLLMRPINDGIEQLKKCEDEKGVLDTKQRD
jgi:hypothetical protein